MNGTTGISAKAALKIATSLDLSPREQREFIQRVGYESAVPGLTAAEGDQASFTRNQKRELSLEMFEIISDWFYLPMYELIKSAAFKATETALSRQLNLPLAQTKAALDRLERIGLVQRKPNGQFTTDAKLDVQTSDDISSLAIQNHHRRMSQKAIEALTQPPAKREFQSLQLLFNPADLERAQARIREFVSQFEDEFRCGKSKSVFQLNMQFFSITKGEEK